MTTRMPHDCKPLPGRPLPGPPNPPGVCDLCGYDAGNPDYPKPTGPEASNPLNHAGEDSPDGA